MPPRRAAVLGSPIAHSLSPVLHRAAYAALGLDWTYDAVEVLPAGLAGFLDGLDPSWRGLSLTMPLKQVVQPLLTELDPLAVATGAVNTVLLPARCGLNTDVHGIVASLRAAGVDEVSWGVVIGAGATAASALAALAELGETAPDVLVRDPSRAGPLLDAAARLGVRPHLGVLSADLLEQPDVDVVVNTTPAGALDALRVDLDPRGLPVLLDVVYAPWPTPLAVQWQRAGGTVVGGREMLLHQAAEQVRLMTGRVAPLEAMRAALPA